MYEIEQELHSLCSLIPLARHYEMMQFFMIHGDIFFVQFLYTIIGSFYCIELDEFEIFNAWILYDWKFVDGIIDRNFNTIVFFPDCETKLSGLASPVGVTLIACQD